TPLLVPLRRFARAVSVPGRTLADFLIQDILVSGWGRSRKDAEAFLRHALLTERAVILLDGLDEVPADRQDAVLEAVHRFVGDRDPRLPTAKARLILTCRRQNFLTLRDKWVYVIKDGVYTLAPLRDAEIFAYLKKLGSRFRDPELGPEAFLHAIRASGTLDLHRTPLVLAMSVGLYAKKTTFEIPSEIAELYGQMITEMLERQAFKADPGTSLLRYSTADKTRFLREFAAGNAEGRQELGERFGEFTRAALYRYATDLAAQLDAVDEPVAFVNEILERSGLIAEVGDGSCVFAHRSIQEYLAAEELRQFDPDGARRLLERARDPAWRQVVLFYTGTTRQSQQAVDTFLVRLAKRDLPLAGHCLAGARATNAVAGQVLHALAERVRANDAVPIHLAAMLSATRSARVQVRSLAVFLVRDVLGEVIGRPDVFEVLGDDLDGVVQILQALAHTDAVHIAELAPKVAAAAPDDARLVAPLWLCLGVPGIEQQSGAARIVERLLTLTMAAEGLTELQRQEPNVPAFVTPALRRRAYPFRQAHPLSSNLVTLLCWAEHLQVIPLPLNRFFEAKRESPDAFARVEGDHGRTQQATLHRPARWLSAAGTVLAAVTVAGLLGADWRIIGRPGGWLMLWWLILPVIVAPVAFFTCAAWAERQPATSFAGQYLRAGAAPGQGRSGHAVAEAYTRFLPGTAAQLLFLLTTPLYGLALLPVFELSEVGYVVAAVGASAVFGWVPFLRAFDREVRFYLYRPNPFSDMYDDGRSRRWLDPDASQTNRPVLVGNRPE
ncbi:MAG: hypothetical protein HKP61_19360, partial [Dactylosporangium sp.]|nr:hypothetical protein [Dactylosporangium sp.]NNJ63048.1 hypothetical protein [Dactylosporangium sp.]